MRGWVLATTALLAASAAAETPDQVVRRYGLAGELLVAKGDKVLLDRGYGPIAPRGSKLHRANERWRLASITKQVTAALVVQAHPDQLDLPWTQAMGLTISAEVAAKTPTVRQLLTHHSGLPNPDDTPQDASGVPAFYRGSIFEAMHYCLDNASSPGGPFRYNNCDYLVVRTVIGFAGGAPDPWPAGLAMAQTDEIGVPGFVAGKPEPHYELASFGAAGGLMGTARAVFHFDRALMTGKLLTPAGLNELWKPEGGRSYQALGQWVFPGTLKGCAKPRRIVQRDGEIGGVQTRNYILPDDDLIVIVFTNRGADDFPIGEVWQGKGFAYDLLSSVACGGRA